MGVLLHMPSTLLRSGENPGCVVRVLCLNLSRMKSHCIIGYYTVFPSTDEGNKQIWTLKAADYNLLCKLSLGRALRLGFTWWQNRECCVSCSQRLQPTKSQVFNITPVFIQNEVMLLRIIIWSSCQKASFTVIISDWALIYFSFQWLHHIQQTLNKRFCPWKQFL